MLVSRRSFLVPFCSCLVAAVTLMLGRVYSSTVSQDSLPRRSATEEDLRELDDKIASLSEFRAVYELKSKKNSGRLVFGFRSPADGFLRFQTDEVEDDEPGEVGCWLADGQMVSKFTGKSSSKYLSCAMREPIERVERLRVALARKVNGSQDEHEGAVTARFSLYFSRNPEEPERIRSQAQVFYVCDDKPFRIRWFDRKLGESSIRRVDDRIEVELEDCQYKFSAETGFLIEAKIADVGTVTLLELQTDVKAKEFEPSQPDANSEDDSAKADIGAMRGYWGVARDIAFRSLANSSETADDDRLGAWRRVMSDFYDYWLPRCFEADTASQTKAVDGFLAWHARTVEAAGGDGTVLDSVAKQTQEWIDRFEKGALKNVDAQAAALAIPPKVEIASSLGERALESEREIVREVMVQQIMGPLLQRLKETTGAGEHK